MSYVKVMIHAVWGTKNRENYITKDIRPLLLSHIRDNAKQKGILIDTLLILHCRKLLVRSKARGVRHS